MTSAHKPDLYDVMQDLFDLACNDRLEVKIIGNPDDLELLFTVTIKYRGLTGVSDGHSSMADAIAEALDRRQS